MTMPAASQYFALIAVAGLALVFELACGTDVSRAVTANNAAAPSVTPYKAMGNANREPAGPVSGQASQTGESTPVLEFPPAPVSKQTDKIREINPQNRPPIKPNTPAEPN